jgi:hypothetical protein
MWNVETNGEWKKRQRADSEDRRQSLDGEKQRSKSRPAAILT